MQTQSDIRLALASRGLRPKRSLGQNFLIDHNMLNKLVDAAAVDAGSLVLEIGPGTGTLTELLLERGAEVVACELDRGLAQLLREQLGQRITLIEGDCMGGKRVLNPEITAALGGRPYTLVANLPYAAATPVLLTLAGDRTCLGQYVTIQREVAARLRAAVSTKDYGALSVVAQAMNVIERIALLPPQCFWPQPKVSSEMIALRPRRTPLTDAPQALERFCHRLFEKRRKQLGSILGRDIEWPEGIAPTQRPEELTVQQLVALAGRVHGRV